MKFKINLKLPIKKWEKEWLVVSKQKSKRIKKKNLNSSTHGPHWFTNSKVQVKREEIFWNILEVATSPHYYLPLNHFNIYRMSSAFSTEFSVSQRS